MVKLGLVEEATWDKRKEGLILKRRSKDTSGVANQGV